MSLLLDTHAVLWFAAGDHRLTTTARERMTDASARRWVSLASLWEVAIKLSKGRLRLHAPFEPFFDAVLVANEFSLLPIRSSHLAAVSALPFPASGHRDPFDRLLVAQAQTERLSVVSGDRAFDDYDLTRVW